MFEQAHASSSRFLATGKWLNSALAAGALLAAFSASALSPVPPPSKGELAPLVPVNVWRPTTITSNFSEGKPIELREVLVDVQVFGDQAQTRIEMRLFNPNARVLEGELQFPLMEGQVVTGFALDVNGKLRDAVPVPKAKGQEIFEDVRRRRVDPGLLEATAGNQYKLRVYPIPANGERWVAITVTETLPHLRDGASLRVPLTFASTVGHLLVQVRVPGTAKGDAKLVQTPDGTDVQWADGGLTLRMDKTSWTVPKGPNGWLQLAIRQASKPQVMVGESLGKRYFAGQFAVKDEQTRRADPQHIALVWDASGSAAAQNRVLPILAAYFGALKNPVTVSLVVVRNRVEPVRTLNVPPNDFAALAKLLQAEPLDGSSNFDSLPIPANADLTVMVTDGLMTDGKRLINYSHSAPVLVINGSNTADVPRLRRLADRTGGAFIDAALASVTDALQAMQQRGLQVVGVSSLDAEHLVMPSVQIQQGRIAVAGEMLDKTSHLEVVLADPQGHQRKLQFTVHGDATKGKWPAQQWAVWRSAELAENPMLHSAEIARITAAQGIVGPNSSLIVLEQARDYAQYNLPAPPELEEEVARLRQQTLAQTDRSRQDHLESMVRQFEGRKAWWDKDFSTAAIKAAEVGLSSAGSPVPTASAELSRAAVVQNAVGAPVAGRQYHHREQAGLDSPSVVSASPPAPAVIAPPPPPAPVPLASPAPLAAYSASSLAAPGIVSNLTVGGNIGAAAKQQPGQAAAQSTIALQAWTPNASYLTRLQSTAKEDMYRVYLDERGGQQNSSAFYMDVAGLFFERGMPDLGLRILSNLAELNLENRQLLRMYAYCLVQARHSDLAVPVFERITELAPNEPQSWRDLGLALADSGQPQLAVNALWEVVSRPWNNSRVQDVGLIALGELNAIDAQNAAGNLPPLDMTRVDQRLRRNLPLALRVVMAWDTDDTDVDLWVTDPTGERASYQNRLTRQGGAMSHDATGGYGPEEFSLKVAKPGKYLVQTQFYGNRQQVLSAGTTVMLRITTGFGTAQAHDEWTSVRLTSGSEIARIAEVEVK